MFTWICPQCGREVPPSYTDCPDCAAKGKTPPAPPVTQPAAPPPPAAQPQPQYQAAPPAYQPPPQQPQYQPPQYQPQYQPPARSGLPTWLMSIVFALAFGGVVLGAYYAVEYFKKDSSAAAHGGDAAAETAPAKSSAADAKGNPIRKHIEIVGLRLTQNKAKKTEVRFLVVNHSGAEIQDLAASVNLQARTSKKDEEPVGTFTFKVPALGAYESKELDSVLATKLKVYELPDWQNLDLRIQFTSP